MLNLTAKAGDRARITMACIHISTTNQKLTCLTPLAANRRQNRMPIRTQNRTCRRPLRQTVARGSPDIWLSVESIYLNFDQSRPCASSVLSAFLFPPLSSLLSVSCSTIKNSSASSFSTPAKTVPMASSAESHRARNRRPESWLLLFPVAQSRILG
jgi:hypothetical protein